MHPSLSGTTNPIIDWHLVDSSLYFLLAITLFLVVLYGISWVMYVGTGIRKLYASFPPRPEDRIITRVGTSWAALNLFMRSPSLRIGIGESALHLRFLLLPTLFRHSLAIPWDQVTLEGRLEDSFLPIFRTAEFRFGPDRFFIRLRGKAARLVQAAYMAKVDSQSVGKL